MSGVKHSKGPWGYNRWTKRVEGKKDQEIAAVRTHTLSNENETPPNGHLIAAAPELLEACKLALRYGKFDGNKCYNGVKIIGALTSAIDKAEPGEIDDQS